MKKLIVALLCLLFCYAMSVYTAHLYDVDGYLWLTPQLVCIPFLAAYQYCVIDHPETLFTREDRARARIERIVLEIAYWFYVVQLFFTMTAATLFVLGYVIFG